MHRIADSPGLMIGVPPSTPNTPTLVIVIVPPAMSAARRAPARAVVDQVLQRAREPEEVERSASLTLGTTSPRGVAAAMPRFT